MEETLKMILSELQHIGTGQKELITSHKQLTIRMEEVEKGQQEVISSTENLKKGQEDLNTGQQQLMIRMEHVEQGQQELISRTANLEMGQDQLKSGQQEIKDIIKHTATLLTENFTTIRRDMKALAFDVNSDVELLFKEVAEVKRKVNKLEHK